MRSLSGGMKRRVLVGQALVHKPPVIVLDEPTAGVDVELRQSLWAFIRKLNRDGHTIILTTHYLEEAEALCARIAMLKAGRVVALDTTQNLLVALRGPDGAAGRASACRTAWRRACCAGWRACSYLGLDRYAELETLLAALRAGRHRDRRARAGRDRPRAGVPADHEPAGAAHEREGPSRGARRDPAEDSATTSFPTVSASADTHIGIDGHGWLTLLYKELLRFWKVSFQTIAAPILTRAAVPAHLLARARGAGVGVRRPGVATRRSWCPAS